jgi:hypothetical protein
MLAGGVAVPAILLLTGWDNFEKPFGYQREGQGIFVSPVKFNKITTILALSLAMAFHAARRSRRSPIKDS